MTNLTRWEPLREMQTMRDMMDRFFEEPFIGGPRQWTQTDHNYPLALDVAEDENHYIVRASVPGVAPDEVDVTLTDNVLTIKGETKSEENIDETNYHLRERRYGSFMRSITLPAAVDADQVEATHENGVLTLRLPKTEAVKPKRIAIKNTVNGQ